MRAFFGKLCQSSVLLAFLPCFVFGDAQIQTKAELYAQKFDTLAVAISPTGSHVAMVNRATDGLERLRITDIKSGKITKDIAFDYGWRFGALFWANDDRLLVQPAFSPKQTNTVFQTLALYAVNASGRKERFLLGPSAGSQLGSIAGKKDPGLGATILSTLPDDRNRILVQIWESGAGWSSVAKLNVYSGDISERTYGPAERPLCNFSLDKRNAPVFCATIDTTRNVGEIFAITKANAWDKVYAAPMWDEDQEVFDETADGVFIGRFPHPTTTTDSLFTVKLKESGSLDLKPIFYHPTRDLAGFSYNREFDFGVVRVDTPTPTYSYIGANERLTLAHQALTAMFADSYVRFTSATKDSDLVIVETSSPDKPKRFFILRTATMELALIKDAAPHLDGRTVAQSWFKFESRDGILLEGLLTKTKAAPVGGILMVHGGPHGPYDRYGYDPETQFLASIGFTVVQVNFRGSGGFGRAFERMGYREWGRKMQNDLYDATAWAVQNGLFKEGNICIYGASYGAYAALAAATFEPNLFSCAAGHVGVYDLEELYRSGDIPERKSGVFYLRQVLGADAADLASRSPSNYAENIIAPILLTAGLDDERAPPKQTKIMVEGLEKHNKNHEVYYTDREGHGFYDSATEATRLERLGTFFLKHVGKKT